MGDNKGETAKKQPQVTQQVVSSPSCDPLEESTSVRHRHPQQPPSHVVSCGSSFISTPIFVPIGATSSPYDQQFETVHPKRQRYSSAQWKLLPSSSQQQKQKTLSSGDACVSPAAADLTPAFNIQTQHPHATAASSSDTTSSPSHSPIPSLSAASGLEASKLEMAAGEQTHRQFRKGKYVSPVWKPDEMLWLARAWKNQYQTGYDGYGSLSKADNQPEGGHPLVAGSDVVVQSVRGKTRAEKDREVADFLNKHGINRDAKTAGTKWDNMLGEFRKVYEWERGGEREHVGKSYFRLSPYERKLHRLPASFDEEVFEELSQFMGSRIRTSQSRGLQSGSGDDVRTVLTGTFRSLPPPPSFKDDDLSLTARRQLAMVAGAEAQYHGGRGSMLGLESSGEIGSSKELKRISKIRMIWEESVSLWGEEGEHHRGRIKLHGSSFLNAEELTFFDDSMVVSTMESFEDGPLKGFSVDRFSSGQQLKVFGRKKTLPSYSTSSSAGFAEKAPHPMADLSTRFSQWEFQDPTEYYLGCLRIPPTTLPSLNELSWYLQEPPPEELRFPLRRDVYKELPYGKEQFFTASTELLDCRGITFDILSSLIRANPAITAAASSSRDSFVGLWDDCINRVVSTFCAVEVTFVRKPFLLSAEELQDEWPNVTGFVRNFCLWRGEEIEVLREGQMEPSSSIVEKFLWTYEDLPYILGYHAVGYLVTFCALGRSQGRIVRTDLYSLDLSSSTERLKAMIPCYRVAGLLSVLADRCLNGGDGIYKRPIFSDFERIDNGTGNIIEMTPNKVFKYFSGKRKWAAVKEVYDILDNRIPHAEYIYRSSETDLTLVFKPRGVKIKPTNCEQLVEALKYVTKALVALHDLSFMHRDLNWEKVMRRSEVEDEWIVCGFDDAVGAPQIYPQRIGELRGVHAPEMGRGLHGVKVDVWGVGHLIKTCGLSITGLPKMLRELQNRCLDQNPEQRPTAADCYHHLLQVQSSLISSAAGGGY